MLVTDPKITLTEEGLHLSFLLPRESELEARKLVYKEKEKPGRPLDLTVKQHRRARSLDANAYLWLLCQAIAEALNVTKETVYRKHIHDMGHFYAAQYATADAEGVARAWASNGIGWIAEVSDNYDGTSTVYLYPGSSTYDTAQFSRLLNSVVEDCNDLGLTVQLPPEVEALLHEQVDR